MGTITGIFLFCRENSGLGSQQISSSYLKSYLSFFQSLGKTSWEVLQLDIPSLSPGYPSFPVTRKYSILVWNNSCVYIEMVDYNWNISWLGRNCLYFKVFMNLEMKTHYMKYKTLRLRPPALEFVTGFLNLHEVLLVFFNFISNFCYHTAL